MDEKVWIGFDLSTQQLKSLAINEQLDIVFEANVHFDEDLPEFRTNDGVHRNNDTVTAPVLMWIKALDIILDRLRINGLDYSQVCGISGCAQQHGSVYWKRNARSILNNLNSTGFLHEQLANCFSLQDSPVWMDSSTSEQCAQLESSIGGPEILANITGSRAYERFTGNQIAKIIQTKKDTFNQTERISLVSSFLASIFIGNYAPIDLSDGSGMNLFDIVKKEWASECIKHINSNCDDLLDKLGPNVVPTNSIIGNISNYFVQRYGFNENCYVVAFTGDNPASLAGLCLGPNDMAISLGTSDTAFFTLTSPVPSSIDGHIFCNPINPEHYMGLICYKNGSLTRERIRNNCSDKCWTKFNQLLESTPRGNFGNIGFYFDLKEIYPIIRGDYRYNCYNNEVISFAPEVEIRACIEGQFLRLKIHAENLGFQTNENTRILATGGASTNESIVKVLADVFNASVYTHSIPNSAAFGSALLAKYAAEKEINYYELTEKLNTKFKFIANASADAKQIYGSMAERYRNLENELNKNYHNLIN